LADEGSEFWFWAGSDGALKTVEQRELLTSLSNGSIPGRAYVWRQGWSEWLQASQVAELVNAVPAGARRAVVRPKMDPDMTRPPPIPMPKNAPIVPVDSNAVNDKPQTALLIDVQIEAQELEAVKPPAPSKRTPPPPAPSRRMTPLGGVVAPIIPVDSNPTNDKPDTGVIDDSEIVIESAPHHPPAPPSKNWVEVSAPAAPPRPAAPAATLPSVVISEKKNEPIVPVDSSPQNDPVTGTLDDADMEIIEAAAAPAANGPEAPTLPETSAPSSGSLDSLARAVEAKRPPRPEPVIVTKTEPQPELGPDSEGPTILADAIVPVSDPDNEAPTQIHPGALKGDMNAPLPSWSEEVDAAAAAEAAAQKWPVPAPTPVPPAPMQQPVYPSYAPPKKSSALPLVLGGLFVFGLLGAAAAGGLFFFKPWESSKAPKDDGKAAASASAPIAAPSAPEVHCTIAREAKRLAPSIVVGVPPYVAPISDSAVAVGIAETANTGGGLEVSLDSLDVRHSFTAPPGSKIVGVVPLASEKGAFVVDRDGGSLGVPHTVDAASPFVLGFGPRGYARQTKDGKTTDIWEGVSATEKATEARVASVEKVGHIVTFRTGGQVRAGWVDPDGTKKTDLTAIDAQGTRFGSPNVAVNDESALVTFAARDGNDSPWTVQLASAKHGLVPNKAKTFALPPGGPGGDAIAPVAAGLPGGHWLLQWTEGSSGSREVRAQVLDDKFEPVGDALRVSAAGKEAGQGVVTVVGERALSLQLVKGSSSYELWGTALSCK